MRENFNKNINFEAAEYFGCKAHGVSVEWNP